MIRLRLFHRQDPSRQIDSRLLDEGEISVGRGIKADWQVADPERDISRLHMTLGVRGGMLTVRDTSANGVFVGNPRARLEVDRAVPISRGESLTFGPYLIVAEEDAAATAPEAPILDDDPFAGGREAEMSVRQRDPFGSALRPDPVKLEDAPGDGVDAWERRREYQAGDWDPVAPHRRPDHSQLIGTPQGWAEPPAAAEQEHGLGFDAPFTSPILREPQSTAADVAIPSDWEVAPATPAAADTGRVVHSARTDAPAVPPAVAVDAPDAAEVERDMADTAPVDPRLPDEQLPVASVSLANAAPDTPSPATPWPDSPSHGSAPTDRMSPAGPVPVTDAILEADPILPPLPAFDPPGAAPILPPSFGDKNVPGVLPVGQAAPSASPAPGDDALFASFCAGARLSPDAFAGEDRVALMERLGAVYRQAILGVADLMSERTALKNDFRMARTTIRPEGNNPFKWVPPQRLAIELLRSEDGSGYSTGEQALNEALHDVKAHMLCVLAGMRGAIGATFDLLSPDMIEARTANRGFVMPGQRNAAAWAEYVDQFATQRHEADDSVDGPINRAFRQAYEDQLRQIDAQGKAR